MPPRKPASRRKKVAPTSLGLAAPETATVDSADLKALSAAIAGDGGVVLAQYRDPFGGKPLILAACRSIASSLRPFSATPPTRTSSA